MRVLRTTVRHGREMWFGQMNTHGANATKRTTCNHSLDWDKRVFYGQNSACPGLECASTADQIRTVERSG
jgi:hypothetical protein